MSFGRSVEERGCCEGLPGDSSCCEAAAAAGRRLGQHGCTQATGSPQGTCRNEEESIYLSHIGEICIVTGASEFCFEFLVLKIGPNIKYININIVNYIYKIP